MKHSVAWKTAAFFICELSLVHCQLYAQTRAPSFLNALMQHMSKYERPAPEITAFDATREMVLVNINQQMEEALTLFATGMSEMEVSAYFNSRKSLSGTGSIAGRLFESNGITPLQQTVSVYAYDEYGRVASTDVASPLQNSSYTLDELPTGQYYVRTVTRGEYRDEFYDDVTDWRFATLVQVNDGQQTGGIDFALLPPGTGAISGLVTEARGIPVTASCYIYAYDAEGNVAGSAATNSTGTYRVQRLAAGRHRVHTTYIGELNLLEEWYNDAPSQSSATPVMVEEAKETRNIDFSLEFGGAISGQVVDSQGKHLKSSDYYILPYEAASHDYVVPRSATTDTSFVLAGLRSGSYKLLVRAQSSVYQARFWYVNANIFDAASIINVSAPDTTKNIVITLPTGAIRGKVFGPTGSPLKANEARIEVYDEAHSELARAYVRNEGVYTVGSLPNGLYKVFVTYTGSMTSLEQPADTWYRNASSFEEAQFVEVNAGDTTSGIDLALPIGGYIMGRVFGPQGQPLGRSGRVTAYTLASDYVKDRNVGSNGYYFIPGLATGAYKLRLQYQGSEGYLSEWYDNKLSFETATPVLVTTGQGSTEMDFVLESPASIKAFLTTTDDNRLTEEDAELQIYAFDAKNGEYCIYTNNTVVGGFSLPLLPGNYKVAAVSVYRHLMAQQDSLAVTYFRNSISFVDTNTQTLVLAPGEARKLDEMTLRKAAGSISGTVYAGSPPQPFVADDGYVIFAFDAQGYLAKVSTYVTTQGPVTGHYLLTGLRAGTYYLLAWLANGSLNSSRFQWYGGIPANITEVNFTPHLTIPPGALAISVMDNLVSGKDFVFDFSTVAEHQTDEYTVHGFKLVQNYPNPFNPSTTFEFLLPQTSFVTLKIYNLLGEEVATLIAEKLTAGKHQRVWEANGLASGVYVYRLEARDHSTSSVRVFVQSRKLVLLR